MMFRQLVKTVLLVSCFTWSASAFYYNARGTECISPEIKFGSTDPRPPFFTWSHQIGTNLTVICDEGYELVGPTNIYCRMNGQWGKIPKCVPDTTAKVSCVLPAMAEGVYIQPRKSQYAIDDIVTFDCTGYKKIDGHSVARCNENGQFEPLPPRCVAPRCDPPKAPVHGTVTSDKDMYSVGDVVSFQCNNGYSLVGDKTSTCGADGKFSDVAVSCSSTGTESSCQLPLPGYRVIITDPKPEYAVYESLSYKCRFGYQVVGSGKLICLPSTMWSGEPKCRRSFCVRPSSPYNGRIENENRYYYKFGQKVKFTCDEGYEIDGETDELVCGNDGYFSPAPPKCKRQQQSTIFSVDSCKSRCNIRHSSLSCQCDLSCFQNGDCCSDFTQLCYH